MTGIAIFEDLTKMDKWLLDQAREVLADEDKTYVVVVEPDWIDMNDYTEHLDAVLTEFRSNTCYKNADIIQLGDFNAHNFDWCPTKPSTSQGKILRLFSESVQLYQITEKPTRPKSATCLDLIFVDNLNLVKELEILPELASTCDHNVLKLNLNLLQPTVTQHDKTMYEYRNANWSEFRSKLADINWMNLISGMSLDDGAVVIEKMISQIADSIIPHKSVTVKSSDCPWFNDRLRELLKRKHELYRAHCKFNTASTAAKSRNVSKEFDRACKLVKKEYYQKLSREMNCSSKSWWRLVKNTLNKGKRSSIPPLLDANSNEQLTDPKQKAELLNQHFAAVCSMPITEANDVPTVIPTQSKFAMSSFTVLETEVFELLAKVDCNKASAPGLSARIVREAAPIISPIITYLFNESLKQELFPQKWKTGYVTAIFKSGNPHEVNNYRPITLLPIISKVFERLIYRKVYGYLTKYQLLSANQSGFRHGDSTVNQLIAIVHEILLAFDKSERVLSVFFDFQKAFDTVWHKGLLTKLKAKGIPQSLVNWFDSYLHGRDIITTVDGFVSSKRNVNRGVPQGSVLGPYYF
ncbi:unnamed protein product [Didymodactylos carnosus]|uniref:Reverse transcriptase domain-containing protein n=1 Tax=Didymodactylos carnosus TaxID=1234261 RepID=A0A815T598_9BILA|nr:unnamed protein product [Didymodactylos carnosus]CAF4359666.1 unnamed protein product [Didymodactylos carnosus]